MIKNVVLDIGNVILNVNFHKIIPKFTSNKKEQHFIKNKIINSPEWLKYSLLDTGFISLLEAIKLIQDRTNHQYDSLVSNFLTNYLDYSFISPEIFTLIKTLQNNNYKVYLLSNISGHTYERLKSTNLFNLVDGYILSFEVHQVKPHQGIYKSLIKKYNLKPSESLFIDDNINNVKTAKHLGFHSVQVTQNNIPSINASLIKNGLKY